MSSSAYEGWAVVELLGHRVRYGRVSEVSMFGEPFVRIEIPSEPPVVEFYAGKSLYGLRPASEESIRTYHAPRRALASGDLVLVDGAAYSLGMLRAGVLDALGIDAETTKHNDHEIVELVRSTSSRRAYLCGALAEAIQHCQLHGEEYGHVTPRDAIDGWQRLVDGGVES